MAMNIIITNKNKWGPVFSLSHSYIQTRNLAEKMPVPYHSDQKVGTLLASKHWKEKGFEKTSF